MKFFWKKDFTLCLNKLNFSLKFIINKCITHVWGKTSVSAKKKNSFINIKCGFSSNSNDIVESYAILRAEFITQL